MSLDRRRRHTGGHGQDGDVTTAGTTDRNLWRRSLGALVAVVTAVGPARAQDPPTKLTVPWAKVARVSRTTPTLQVVVNPPLRRGHPVHDGAFRALRDLQADYVRYVPWLPYPRLGVAELEPPKDGKTSWDFSLIDPMTIDFLEATKGHPVVLNFSTIPQWMVRSSPPVGYPADPDQPVWDYTQGNDLRDPTFEEVGGYYARLLGWYTQGGFTDDLGQRHESGHHYAIPYWEVLNEPDLERDFTPEAYTRLYDAVVRAMLRVQRTTKFGGVSLAYPARQPRFFEYFLDQRNHAPGIPIDFVSYHFYAVPAADEPPEVQPYTFFAQAAGFLGVVRYVEAIRERLSPATKTMINEIGTIAAEDLGQGQPGYASKPIPASYWSLSGAVYAYLFGELTRMGIDAAGESQLVGYPTQFPSVSLVEWERGTPNPRYRVLELIARRIGPGDGVVDMPASPGGSSGTVYAQGFVKPDGKRRLLLVNTRDRVASVVVAGASGGEVEYVDQTTGFGPAASARLEGDNVALNGLAVAVVTLP
ncbi:MAG TPA: glycosyl hydrolase family 39 [Vicinamibacteria bacterium]|nr:glycosyl hydrolase family 39 [Vicinamibacteria bacterium]